MNEYVELTSKDDILIEINSFYTKLFTRQQLDEHLQDTMLRNIKKKGTKTQEKQHGIIIYTKRIIDCIKTTGTE